MRVTPSTTGRAPHGTSTTTASGDVLTLKRGALTVNEPEMKTMFGGREPAALD
jgi:hypothetical protein